MIYLLDTSGLVRLLGEPALQEAWYDAADAEAIGSCHPQRTEFLSSAGRIGGPAGRISAGAVAR